MQQNSNTLFRLTSRENTMQLDEEAALGMLNFLDKDALQELNDSDEKLDDLIGDVQQVKNLSNDKEMLITSNKSLAEYNLALEPRLRQGRELLCIQYDKAGKLKEEYDTLRSVLDSKSEGQSLDTTHAVLQTKAAQSEEETDKLSELFLDKQVECEDFLERYMEARANTHLLKIKSEKLGEMIQHHASHGIWDSRAAPAHQQPPQAGYPHNQTANPPYPMYPQSAMPQLHLPPVSN